MKITLGDMKCGEETFLYFFLHYKGKTVPPSTLKMACRLKYSFIVATTFLLNIDLCYCLCARAEYKINGECCPMCAPGYHVLNHCNSNSGTECIQCTGSTYTDVPNVLMACLPCTVCEEGAGLRVKINCTYILDTLCEPLPGHYCTEPQCESCRKAQEHLTCLPGQYINQTGTALTDTVCTDCPAETYSNGSFMHCKPHTNCESLGQITITQGTQSSDAECSHKPLHLGLIAVILLLLILLIVIISLLIWKRKNKFNTCSPN